MKLDFKCLKCGSDKYEVKNVMLPEKNEDGLIGFEMSLYYFKTCLNCGYTETYSAKILNKNKELSFDY
ncbi:MAG: zinc ribbon domain-containing protein [Fusobacteriota bacterium]